MLHAAELRLPHPATGELMTFQAAPPGDFAGLASSLVGKEASGAGSGEAGAGNVGGDLSGNGDAGVSSGTAAAGRVLAAGLKGSLGSGGGLQGTDEGWGVAPAAAGFGSWYD